MSLATGSSSQPPAVARPPERFRLHVHPEDGNESRAIIVVSFVANVLVATAKTVAALITRSSSMRTEAVHSWVDVGNECFVVAAARSARLPAGRAARARIRPGVVRVVAVRVDRNAVTRRRRWRVARRPRARRARPRVGLLRRLRRHRCVVRARGVSFVQTIHQLRKGADELGRDLFEHALSTSNSTLRAVFTEDFTALVALVVAALGMALHQLTGVATYDGVGRSSLVS